MAANIASSGLGAALNSNYSINDTPSLMAPISLLLSPMTFPTTNSNVENQITVSINSILREPPIILEEAPISQKLFKNNPSEPEN